MQINKLAIAALLAASGFVVAPNMVSAQEAMPDTGWYFIVNKASGQAVDPWGVSPGQNVFLQDFKKSGRQKWQFIRQVDKKTGKPLNKYLVKANSDSEGLNLSPHYIAERTAILDSEKNLFTVVPTSDGYKLTNAKASGDSMYAFHVENLSTEVYFGPDEADPKYRWDLIKTEQ